MAGGVGSEGEREPSLANDERTEEGTHAYSFVRKVA